MKTSILSVGLLLAALAPRQEEKELRVGIVGLDTSHAVKFAEILNDKTAKDHVPGARVVVAFKGGSPDVEQSASRIDRFTGQLREKYGVELVDSIEALCGRVDAVLLTSVDGRVHLDQARKILQAGKPVFIDKPLAASLKDGREIARLSKETGTPFFTTSSLRFAEALQSAITDAKIGRILGCEAWSPAHLEPHHPDLFWYGIHGVEILYTVMGPGCESVRRWHTADADVVVARWKDGRLATLRGARAGASAYGAVVHAEKDAVAVPIKGSDFYRSLMTEIVRFFRTGKAPVAHEVSLEILAFMEAADLSKKRDGAPATIEEVMR